MNDMRTVNIYTAMMKIPKQRWLQHLLFWLLAFYILLRIFAGSAGIEKIDVIYTLIFIATLLPGIYLNLFVLISRVLSRKRYVLYSFLLLLCVFATACLNIPCRTRKAHAHFWMPMAYAEFMSIARMYAEPRGFRSTGWMITMMGHLPDSGIFARKMRMKLM